MQKHSPGFTVFNYALLLMLGIVMAFPFYWMLATSFKTLDAVYEYPPEFIPKFKWAVIAENYYAVLFQYNFLRYTGNSLIIAISASVGQLVTCSLAGFAFARMVFKAKELLFGLLIGTMLIPVEVVIIPEFVFMTKLGWVGTYLPLIVPSLLVGSTGTFLLRSFFENVPKELEEAAVVDGAGSFWIYWRVFLPLARAPLSALFIIAFLGNWNDLLRPLVYLNEQKMFTLPLGLMTFIGQYSAQWNFLLAGAVVSIVPLLIVYFILQKQFIEGVAGVGIKG
jgi:multiple sugar transport system permease protein